MLTKRDHTGNTTLIIILSFVVFGVLGAIGIFVSCYRRRGHKRLMNQKRLVEAKNRGKYVQLDEEKGDEAGSRSVQLEDRTGKARGDVVDGSIGEGHAKVLAEAEPLVVSSGAEKAGSRRELAVQKEEVPGFSGLTVQDGHGLFLPPPPVASYDSGRRQSLPGSRGSYEQDHSEYYDGRMEQIYDRSRTPSPERTVLSRSVSMLAPR